MLINDYKALRVDKDVIPTKRVYEIVNQFFIFAKEHESKDVKFPCLQTWVKYSEKSEDFPIYAYVARRYGFSVMKRRFDIWSENGKKIVERQKNGKFKFLIEEYDKL